MSVLGPTSRGLALKALTTRYPKEKLVGILLRPSGHASRATFKLSRPSSLARE